MRLNHNLVYALHILLIAPFFAYLGWYGQTANENTFILCKVLSIVIALYHTYLLLKNNSYDHINNLPNFPNLSTYTNIFNPVTSTTLDHSATPYNPATPDKSVNINENTNINEIKVSEDI